MHGSPLDHQVSIFNELRQRIATANAMDADDEAVIDTADGECDLSEMIVRALREAKITEAMVDGLSQLQSDLALRKQRLETKVDRLRNSASWAMSEVGLSRITADDMTISMRAGKPELIIDDERLPIEFKRVKVEPNKVAIRKACDDGDVPDGVQLGNCKPVLTIKIK